MPLRLKSFTNFGLKGLDEISQCPAAARAAAASRGVWRHFHVAWLPVAGSPSGCNAGTLRAARTARVLCLCCGSARTFWGRIAVAGTLHARGGAVAGGGNGFFDVEGLYAAQLSGCE